MQSKFQIHVYSSVYVIGFSLNLRIHSQWMIKLDLNAWKTFEILCLSKTLSEFVFIHSGRVIQLSSFRTIRMARGFDIHTAAPTSMFSIVYCGSSRLERDTLQSVKVTFNSLYYQNLSSSEMYCNKQKMNKKKWIVGAVLLLCRFGSVLVYLNIGVIHLEIMYDKSNKMLNIVIYIYIYNFRINTTPTCFPTLWVHFRECTPMFCYFNTFQKISNPVHL